MRYIFLCLALAPMLAPTAAAAQDQCALAFGRSEMTVSISAPSPAAMLSAVENFTVDIRSIDGAPCQARIQAARIEGTKPNFPSYSLRQQGQEMVVQASEAASAASFGTTVNVAGGGTTTPIAFQIGFPSSWDVDAGYYEERLQLSLVNAGGEIVDRMILNVKLAVPSAATLSLVGAVSGSDTGKVVALGTLSQTTETRSPDFGLRVWSNGGYNVLFASEHQGHLVHSNAVDRISYRMTMNSAPVNLTGPAIFPFQRNTSTLGDFHRLAIVVPPVGQALAGDYSDRITVTITAN